MMKCQRCQSENPSGSKYCSDCGAALTHRCPRCDYLVAPESRFCGMCGHWLSDKPVTDPSAETGAIQNLLSGRRHATVMFTDVSGYTALTERMDPEDVHRVISDVKNTATRIIEKHTGIVNQFVGDEAMALFGIPNATEDDPVRAIKAALELRAHIRDNIDDLLARTGEGLQIHIGINTGLMVAEYSPGLEGLYRLTGDAVNMAARLRSLAEADQILIGPSTQRLVKFFFETVPYPPVRVKGRAAAIVPYEVVAESRISSRFEAARERGFKGYIGRKHEQETLLSCLRRAISGNGQLVTIEGEAGIGKSRLVYEFLSNLDRNEISTPQGRCQPYGSEVPYFSFLDGLRHGLRLKEHDNQAEALETAVRNIKQIAPSLEKYLPHLLYLLSIPSHYKLPPDLKGESLRRALEEAIVAIITLSADVLPMVLIIEDWHWSDPASQSALRYLLRLIPSYRLMVVITYRSAYQFDFGKIVDHATIRLTAMDEAETEELVAAVIGAAKLPPGLAAMISRSADGNPLFIEEACYSLLESGALSVEDSAVVLHQSLDRLLLPDTVQAVIRARLDRLEKGAKEVIGPASVIGRVFSERVLSSIYLGRSPLAEALEVLQAQEIIQQTKILPEPEYGFRHLLMREVAYETLFQQQRKQLHGAVGSAIEKLYPTRTEENASILFHHYLRSPRADKAVQYALLAGERAASLYANTEASAYFKDALDIVKALPISAESERWRIDAILGQAGAGSAPGNRRNLEEACEIAERLCDRRRRALALYWLGRMHYLAADLPTAIEHARRSLEISDELEDAALAAPPVNLMGRAYWQLGDFARSAHMMERSVEQMRAVANSSEEATAAGFLSALLGYMGEFEKALSFSDLSIELAKKIKNPYAEAAALHYRGIIHDQQGRWELALEQYSEAKKVAEQAGDMFRVYIVGFMEGRACLMAGKLAQGIKLIEDSIALAARIGTQFLLGQAKTVLASCRLADDRLDEARSLSKEAISLAENAGDQFTQSLARRSLAECLARTGAVKDLDEASDLVLAAIAMQEEIGAKPELGRSYVSLAEISKMKGDEVDFGRSLRQAMRLFADLNMCWDNAQAKQFQPHVQKINPSSAA